MSQYKLILRTLEIQKRSLNHQLNTINQSIHKLDDNITKLDAYSKPYKEYEFSTQSMHSHFLINNDIFLATISKTIASAQAEKNKLVSKKQQLTQTYHQLIKKIDGVSTVIHEHAIKQQLIRDDREDTEQTDRFNS